MFLEPFINKNDKPFDVKYYIRIYNIKRIFRLLRSFYKNNKIRRNFFKSKQFFVQVVSISFAQLIFKFLFKILEFQYI